MEKHVKHFFDTHKEHNVCFETSDGFKFFERQNADAHSFTLKDKTVTEHKRSDDVTGISDDATKLAASQAESQRLTEAKNTQELQTTANDLVQKSAEADIAKEGKDVVDAAVAAVEKGIEPGSADSADQAGKSAAAVVGNAAAEAGADKVKTRPTPPAKDKAKGAKK